MHRLFPSDNKTPMNFFTTSLSPTLAPTIGLSEITISQPSRELSPSIGQAYNSWKPRVDFVLGLLLMVVLAPIVGFFAVLVKLTSRGPAFYKQTRMGLRGKPFIIWKLRSMTNNCEKASGAQWSTKGDQRVTLVGRFIRRVHIDEFPQILNVLKGEMSLVGPRPERPEFLPMLQQAIPNYSNRLMVKPGISGLAQVYLPADQDLDSVRKKQIYDLEYIRTFGFSLDIRLMIATVLQAVGVPHRLVRPALALPTSTTIEAIANRSSSNPLATT